MILNILRYCKTAFKECGFFEDQNHIGYSIPFKVLFDDWIGTRFNHFYVSQKRNKETIFSHLNIFGVFGLGRGDSDIKYGSTTIEEVVEAGNLASKHCTIYFGDQPRVMIGKIFEFKKGTDENNSTSVEMYEFEIINTWKYSFESSSISIGPSALHKNKSKNSKPIPTESFMKNIEFELNINEQWSTLPLPIYEELVRYITETLLAQGLPPDQLSSTSSSTSSTSSSTFTLYHTNLTALNSYFSLTLSTPSGPVLIPSLFMQTSPCVQQPIDDRDYTSRHRQQPCQYRMVFRGDIGAMDTGSLGLGVLQDRVVSLGPNSFKLSKGSVKGEMIEKVVVEGDSKVGQLLLALGFVFINIAMMVKSCQYCVKVIVYEK